MVQALATDPSSSGTLYAGTSTGLVFKTIDGGKSWNAGSPFPSPVGEILTLAIDSTSPATLYAGCGAGGVFKSTDGGTTWTAIDSGLSLNELAVYALAIDPAHTATIYAGTSRGVFKTTDGGANWSSINSGPLNPTFPRPAIYALTIDPAHPGTLYAGGSLDTRTDLFKTTNGGLSWTAINPANLSSTHALAIDPTHPATLYAAGFGGVFKTGDGGRSWIAVNSGLPAASIAGSPSFLEVLAIDPTNPATLYAGTSRQGLFKTVDGGESWSAIDSGLTESPPSINALAIDATNAATLYAGTSTGVFKTTRGGKHWSAINSGLTGTPVERVVIDPASPATLYTFSDLSGFKTIDGGASWSAFDSGVGQSAGNTLAIDPTNPETLYAGGRGVAKSGDGGATWAQPSLIPPTQYGGIRALAIDPTKPATVYAVEQQAYQSGFGMFSILVIVHRSTDGGTTWTAINSLPDALDVFALAIDPANSATLYAGTDRGLLKSANGGGSWTAVLPHHLIRALALDPDNPTTLYAATESGVFKSTDGGASWTSINAGLPSGPFSALAIDPTKSATLYASTFVSGVFKTTDGGSSWTAHNAGLPSGNRISGLAFAAATSTLYAATDRGVFALTDSGPGPPCVASDTTLCIGDRTGDARWQIRVLFDAHGALFGAGHAIPLASLGVNHGGLFWFFGSDNPEMLIKILNACSFNRRHWVFYAAGTDVGLTTVVKDTETGRIQTYLNSKGTAAPPVEDIGAFDCESGAFSVATPAGAAAPGLLDFSGLARERSGAASGGTRVAPAVPARAADSGPGPACVASDSTLCIDDRAGDARWQISVLFDAPGTLSGAGHAIPLASLGVTRGGLFWFFGSDNPEMLVKVIDGCSLNGKRWVFFSAGTNVGFTVTVTDTRTGFSATYTNPDGTAAAPVQDTSALPCG
ncbi:MAG TPA: hypothetical protein VHQ90_12760 [Thermoanaerobaculia bacterium]|nr:hypothetical protein [Thermoanaerobaculia bacterium]